MITYTLITLVSLSLLMWKDKLEMEPKKGKLWVFEKKNIILTQSLGKTLRFSHMQRIGKFVTPSMYFQMLQRPTKRQKEKENRLWTQSINQLIKRNEE